MERKDQDSVIAKQERAIRQQQLLEKKRRARAEYNVSDSHTNLAKQEKRQEQLQKRHQKAVRQEKQKKEKQKKLFESGFQSSVAYDDAEGVSVSQWFLSICWLNIPVIGFIYMLYMALSHKVHPAKKNFARGYLIYRCLVLILSVTILYVLYQVGLSFIDDLLSFAK